MKHIIVAFTLLAISQASFSQDEDYSVSYYDNGAVIYHNTCRLALHSEFGEWTAQIARDNEFIDFLALKGYRAYEPSKDGWHEEDLKKAHNTLGGDLVLSISSVYNSKRNKLKVSGDVGLLSHDKKNILEMREFSPQLSKERRNINFWDYTPFQSLSMKRFKKSAYEMYEKLPRCVTKDSGHSYEKEKYNTSIPATEMQICVEVYTNAINLLEAKRRSNGMQLSSIFGYGSVATGLIASGTGVVLFPVGGTLLGIHYGIAIPRNIKIKRMKEARRLIGNIANCFVKMESGEECKREDLLNKLNKNSKRKVEKYLEFAEPSELTQSVSNYLGSTRACSETAKTIHKISVKKILKDVGNTL